MEDISRQHIAGHASFVVNPAPWYVGVMMPSYFVDQQKGLDSAVVAVSNEGTVTPGLTVHVSLHQIQWHSVRRAEGQGFYAWETIKEETDAGSWTVTTGSRSSLPAGRGSFPRCR